MPSAWRVPPFGHVRIISRLQIPAHFRSLPRPSSLLEAQASSVCTFIAFLADFALVEIVVRITLFYFYSFFKYYNNYNTDCSFLYLSIFFPILSMNLFPGHDARYDFQYQTRRIPTANISDLLQKGGVPATPSGTATLLRLSPSHPVCP